MGRGGRCRAAVPGIPALAVAAVLLPWLLLGGCAGMLHWEPDRHVVREGETLYTIAWRHGLDHRELARWNDLDDPGLIHPGQELRLTPPVDSDARQDADTSRSTGQARRPGPTREAAAAAADIEWAWPARGEVVTRFDAVNGASKGIDIAGAAGDPVQAAAAGRVVYSGSGLIGYGQLIIVKHTSDHLSAYAYNRRSYVEEGDQVAVGDAIAEMGVGDGNRPMLHFEIRVEGQPVDPLPLLPDG